MTTKPTTARTLVAHEQVAQGELLKSELHGLYVRFVRFVRWSDGFAVVADRNTMVELPDYVHASQLRRC